MIFGALIEGVALVVMVLVMVLVAGFMPTLIAAALGLGVVAAVALALIGWFAFVAPKSGPTSGAPLAMAIIYYGPYLWVVATVAISILRGV